MEKKLPEIKLSEKIKLLRMIKIRLFEQLDNNRNLKTKIGCNFFFYSDKLTIKLLKFCGMFPICNFPFGNGTLSPTLLPNNPFVVTVLPGQKS